MGNEEWGMRNEVFDVEMPHLIKLRVDGIMN